MKLFCIASLIVLFAKVCERMNEGYKGRQCESRTERRKRPKIIFRPFVVATWTSDGAYDHEPRSQRQNGRMCSQYGRRRPSQHPLGSSIRDRSAEANHGGPTAQRQNS